MVSFPLSSRTIGYLVEAIPDAYSATEMDTLFLKAGVDSWRPEEARNKEARTQGLLARMVSDGTGAARTGGLELVRLVLDAGHPWQEWWQPLFDALAADGFEFDADSGGLVPTVPGATMADEVTWIEAELSARGWSTAAGHYKQAVDNFADGNWAAANSQLRAFLESTVTTATGRAASGKPGQVQAGADDLDAAGHLIAGEAAFLKSLWKLLHPGGSHPGLSDEDESRFRLLALTGYVRFLLSRLP